MRKLTTDEFIEQSKKVHGNRFDYSLVDYKNSSTKVLLKCDKGHLLEITPSNHFKRGCARCSRVYNQEDFILTANIKHNFKYDYSKVNYINAITPIEIRCPIHDITFLKKPNTHLRGSGCNNCSQRERYTTESFIKKAKLIHGNKYDYSKTEYINYHTKVEIICKIHGSFFMSPCGHFDKHNCSKCAFNFNTFKKDDWIKRANGRNGIFYVIRCFNENESFYKFGITFNTIKYRYYELPYKYEIIVEEKSDDLNYIWNLEKECIIEKLEQHYVPLNYFKGCKNECYKN